MRIENLPAHPLLVHFVVVLIPLTGILLILCALWPAARRRLTWLVVALAGFLMVLTPVTIAAGEWLADQPAIEAAETPEMDAHMDMGGNGLWVAIVLLVAAALLAWLHLRLDGGHQVQPVVQWIAVAVIIGFAVVGMYEIHKIGKSGAESAWGWCCDAPDTADAGADAGSGTG